MLYVFIGSIIFFVIISFIVPLEALFGFIGYIICENKKICITFLSIVIIVSFVVSCYLNRNDSSEQIREKAQTYTIYIDGTKVDSEKIDIDNYSLKKITVNDEKEEVYIAS